MANSGVSGAIRTIPVDQQELALAPIEDEEIDGVVVRKHQRGLRTVDNEPGGALRRAGLEEGRQNIVAPRTDRKDGTERNVVLEVGRPVERIDRDAKRRLGIERFRQRRFLGQNRGDRGRLQARGA